MSRFAGQRCFVELGTAVLPKELTNMVSGSLTVTEFNVINLKTGVFPTEYLKMEVSQEDKRLI